MTRSHQPTLAGDAGFEPAMPGPEPGALPLGQSPITMGCIIAKNCCIGRLMDI